MPSRGSYKTKQRELVRACLLAHANRYLSVDDVRALVESVGESVGRTTVYRTLEALVQSGQATKLQAPSGEQRYHMAGSQGAGQLVCLDCGSVMPLECHELAVFSEHVREHHGFAAELAQSVLYGHCASCQKEAAHAAS